MLARKFRHTPRVLHTEEDYEEAVAEIERLADRNPAPGSPEYDRLELLGLLIEDYEDEHYPMGETSTPQSIVATMLEAKGMTRADLAPVMGGKGRVSEFFAGKRRLSITQIENLRALLGIPADLLL